MTLIVGVHGIAQEFKGPNLLHDEWITPLRDGLHFTSVELKSNADFVCVSYGDLFRPSGTKSFGIPPLEESDVNEWEAELLQSWLDGAVSSGEVNNQTESGTRMKGRTPQFVQRALELLSHTKFFADAFSERAMIWDLKQVYLYLHDANVRENIRQRVCNLVDRTTRVMIGHSLGSIVAYECLCAHPEWPITTFVTVGSPLAIRNVIFEQLQPTPINGHGAWPGNLSRWTNIADSGDIVALVKSLAPSFGDRVENKLIYNGATAHNISPYLTAKETGFAIASGLSD